MLVKTIFSAILLFIISTVLPAQSELFEQGLALEREFKMEEALVVYEKVLKNNPNHAEAVIHASRMLSNIGGRLPASQNHEKVKYLLRAMSYGERAIRLVPNEKQAHLAYVISLGLLSETSMSASERVKHAKIIYDEGTTMLKLDSTFAVAYFVLGKWHFELARLSWFERMACEIFFGGLPEDISMDKAVLYLRKANELEPNTILYLFGEARVYYHLGNKAKAVSMLKHALTLPIKEPDDIARKERCKDLLKEIEAG